jgi:acetyl esterase/lipase
MPHPLSIKWRAIAWLSGTRSLRDDGVPVELDEVPGILHGFFNLQGFHEAKAATKRVAHWLAPRW